jgi:uncharacterized membrane protein YfcA
MEIVYALLFILIGFSLGLIGGGGSILAVPVLVYVLGYEAQIATGYSLFIIGITSFIGAFAFLKKRDFSLEAILQFAIPSVISVFCVRKYLVPNLPDVFFNNWNFSYYKTSFNNGGICHCYVFFGNYHD